MLPNAMPWTMSTGRTTTKSCPVCLEHNQPRGRAYRCTNPDCAFTCHRDAVGSVNIWTQAHFGEITPIGEDTKVRVTYLRAVPRWSQVQWTRHAARSRAKNQASGILGNQGAGCGGGDARSLAAVPSGTADPLVVAA